MNNDGKYRLYKQLGTGENEVFAITWMKLKALTVVSLVNAKRANRFISDSCARRNF